MTLSEIRKEVYDYHRKQCIYVFNWRWYVYRKYKVIFFMESASILTFLLLKTPVTPNMLTLLYIILGILAGILLALPLKSAVLAAAILIFLKPILDWADGVLARIRKQTSATGDILDNYSPSVGWSALWAGLGIYLGNSFNPIFYYLAPILPSLFATDIYRNAEERFIRNYFTKPELRVVNKAEIAVGMTSDQRRTLIRKIKDAIDSFFEYNTRTVDIICLLLLIEIFSSIRIVWIFYISFLIWQLIVFAFRLFIAFRGGWAEKELDKLRRTLYG